MHHASEYDYARDHSYGKRVSPVKTDYFLEHACTLALLALWWVDERGTTDCLSVWEDAEMRAIAEGDCSVPEYIFVVPVMRAVAAGALDCVWRVLGAAGMSWREAEHLNAEVMHHWRLPDDAAFHAHPQYYLMVAKLECFLCGPDQVEASEVLDYLPQSDSCKWVRDRVNHIFSSTESLGVLISKAALALAACGDSPACIELAASHAKAAAARHRSPQKVMHAHAALGGALSKGGGVGRARTSAEANGEALALLEMALEASAKMRTRRYSNMIGELKLHLSGDTDIDS